MKMLTDIRKICLDTNLSLKKENELKKVNLKPQGYLQPARTMNELNTILEHPGLVSIHFDMNL